MIDKQTKKWPRPSFSMCVLIGLVLGIACGVFFGEYCAPLQIIGDVFIKLLQMTILPYIVVSLIYGIGRLNQKEARTLASKAGSLLLVCWAIGIAVILMMPLAFPDLQTASFFSTSLLEQPKQVDYVDLYVPSNPFRSMANNVVPAVVLFSFAMGVALIGIKEKDRLNEPLSVVSATLMRVASKIIKITPLGVFALTASAAGTMGIEELGRLQVYFVAYLCASLLLTFWVLPMMVTFCTPFKYKQVIGLAISAMVTAFATGNLFIVLPVLAENIKQLLREHGLTDKRSGSLVDVVLPVAFSFPTLGKLMVLLFVPFAGWYTGNPIPATEYPALALTGAISFFGSVTIAVPFLLDSWQIPIDMFQLFIMTAVINGRLSSMLATMNLFVLVTIVVWAIQKGVRLNGRRLIIYSASTVAFIAGTLFATGIILKSTVVNTYDKHNVLASMHLIQNPVPAVMRNADSLDLTAALPGLSHLEAIRKRGTLRVGYNPDRLPFAFFNQERKLVGFDIDMAHHLADDMGVTLEFIPTTYDTMTSLLRAGHCDIVMSGIAVTEDRIGRVRFSDPYLDVTLALVVTDNRRQAFGSIESIEQMEYLRIGVVQDGYFAAKLKERFPRARIVLFKTIQDFLDSNGSEADALLLSAEGGSAWCMLYPQFQVVIPQSNTIKQPLAYAIAPGDRSLLDFMNQWINVKRKRGMIQRLYDYWILGRGAKKKKPRWSIIRDVLHWVESP